MKKQRIANLFVLLIVFGIAPMDTGHAVETYPVKPITVIVPFEPGAGGDIKARPLIEKASAILGKPLVIVNKPGAGQVIGYREIYKAKPDGYTIGMCSMSLITAKLLGFSPYDYRDFALIGRPYHSNPIVIAATKTERPFKTIEEVFSFAKSSPGELSVATTAFGGPYWTATMLIQEKTGLKI
jgi:tripartite-type tricarboxylate transporter receptor subunit TctC